jgi:peroxiredoxin
VGVGHLAVVTALDLIARAVLVIVFAVAAVTKARDPDGTRAAAEAFGAPAGLARPLARMLPVLELLTAILLVPGATALTGAILATLLLAAFTIAIAVALARGKHPACNCFGQTSAAPIGLRTLARNGGLMVLAILVAAEELRSAAPDPVAWYVDRGVSAAAATALIVAALAIAGAAALAIVLLRSHGALLVRIEELEARAGIARPATVPQIGLAPGTAAPDVRVKHLDGTEVPLRDLVTRRLLVIFSSPRCGPCQALVPDIAEWQRTHRERVRIILAVDADPDDARAEAEEHDLEEVVIDRDGALMKAFQATGTPSAVLVGRDGAVATWVAIGAPAIADLLGYATAPEPLAAGDEAPRFELPALDGGRVSLTDLAGRESLLVFWNPDCGYCQGMRDDLLAYEADAADDAPALVIVSAGAPERTREDGFTSTVLIDPDRAVSTSYRANGTPMGILVGPDGRVASSLAVGAVAVLDLVRPAMPIAVHRHPGRPAD